MLFFLILSLPLAGMAADWIWVEGESAVQQDVTANSWYDAVPAAAFSQEKCLAHMDDTRPGTAEYVVEADQPGEYQLWLRANPRGTRIRFQLNGSRWQELAFLRVSQEFPLAGWDLRFLAWIQTRPVSLKAGRNELRFELDGDPKPHGMLDCFLLSRTPFIPWGVLRPDEIAESSARRARREHSWFDFQPSTYTLMSRGAIDLRSLNEAYAGEQGRILARDGEFVHSSTGQPVRFWAVNGPPHDLDRDALPECARLLARYGVNLVRIHGRVFDEQTGEFQPETARRIAQVVEAMKREGIYTHLSIYFPLWFKPKPDLEWLPGYDGNQHPFAALMFNPEFQQRYEQWWQQLLTTKLADGEPLFRDPALMGVELQNEDSFFFWTFNEQNLPDPQLRVLESQFGDWLIRKYGSLDQAFQAWNGARLSRDDPAEGRVGFRPLWDLFNSKTIRDQDTATFLYEKQVAFYERELQFLRGLGFEGLVTCSNWITASPEVLGPLEKLSYTIGDFVDRHGYLSCRNGGLFSEWSIRDGHTFVNRSALRFDGDEPGAPKQFRHPIIDIQYDDKPSMISETTWNRPNRYRSEAPLFLAAYGALQETDAIVHFAMDGAHWSVKPQYFMQPWTLMAPSQMGQFPAAALIYRRGLVTPGAMLADLTLNVDDLKQLKGTALPQDAAFDELRLKDVPPGTFVLPGNRIDPLIHFAGRTRIAFSQNDSTTRLADLNELIDREQQLVKSSHGQLELNYGTGVLTMNAASAQGASGNLQAAGEIQLNDVIVQSPLDLAHIVLVALDEKPLATSQRILLQVMSEERSSGFRVIPQNQIQLIQDIGTDPWQVRELEGEIRMTRPDANQLSVTALDLNGVPVQKVGSADRLSLLPNVIYYLISTESVTARPGTR